MNPTCAGYVPPSSRFGWADRRLEQESEASLKGHTKHPAFSCVLPFEETELSRPLARPCPAKNQQAGEDRTPGEVEPDELVKA